MHVKGLSAKNDTMYISIRTQSEIGICTAKMWLSSAQLRALNLFAYIHVPYQIYEHCNPKENACHVRKENFYIPLFHIWWERSNPIFIVQMMSIDVTIQYSFCKWCKLMSQSNVHCAYDVMSQSNINCANHVNWWFMSRCRRQEEVGIIIDLAVGPGSIWSSVEHYNFKYIIVIIIGLLSAMIIYM